MVILGLMGAGKTTVGGALAGALGRRLSDSDEVIARTQGATVRDLNAQLGTAGMHRLEAQHLLDALADPEPSVIAAAASVVDDPRSARALRADDVFTVWLEGRPDTLAARFATGPHRPVLGADPEELFRRQIQQRADRYGAVARLRIEVDGRGPDDVAAEILKAIAADPIA